MVVALLGMCVTFPACTTTRHVSLNAPPSATQPALEPGRKAVILLRSGVELRGTIVAADENGLTLRSRSASIRGVSYGDMESLQTSRISTGRTAAAIGGGLVGALGAFILIMNHIHADDD